MLKRILVPLDGSACSEHALPVAATIAHINAGTITLVRVVPSSHTQHQHTRHGEGEHVITEEEARQYLVHIAGEECLEGIGIHTEILSGNPMSMVATHARVQEADLIILCRHGNRGFQEWLQGSMARQLIQRSTIPTLVLRDSGVGKAMAHIQAEQPFSVLVGLDGSALAETVLEPAALLSSTLSSPHRGKLHLLRVIQPAYLMDERAVDIVNAMNHQAIQEAQSYLDEVKGCFYHSDLARYDLEVTSAIALETEIADTLARVAEHGEVLGSNQITSGFDAIALATHGRTGLPRLIEGSVAERLLNETTLPLLIMHNQDSQPQRPIKPQRHGEQTKLSSGSSTGSTS